MQVDGPLLKQRGDKLNGVDGAAQHRGRKLKRPEQSSESFVGELHGANEVFDNKIKKSTANKITKIKRIDSYCNFSQNEYSQNLSYIRKQL